MIKKILFPTDFSDASKIGTEAVKKLKQIGVEEVCLTHVIDLNKIIGPVSGVDIPTVIENYEKESLENLKKFAENLRDFNVKIIPPKVGDPASTICDIAEEENVDMIAIPSHGKGLLAEILLGSVSEGVVKKSRKPVFVIKFKDVKFDDFFKRILYCYDFSENANKLRNYVKLFAKIGGEVLITHVIEKGKLEDEKLKHLDIIREEFENAKIILREGVPYKEILRVADEMNATLIAMGHSGEGLLRYLGGTSYNVVRRAKIPVFVYKT